MTDRNMIRPTACQRNAFVKMNNDTAVLSTNFPRVCRAHNMTANRKTLTALMRQQNRGSGTEWSIFMRKVFIFHEQVVPSSRFAAAIDVSTRHFLSSACKFWCTRARRFALDITRSSPVRMHDASLNVSRAIRLFHVSHRRTPGRENEVSRPTPTDFLLTTCRGDG